MRGEAGLQAGHGTEQENLYVSVKLVLLRQRSERRRREMNEPLTPSSEIGQLVGHVRELGVRGHSASLTYGLSPSTNKENLSDLLTSTRLRAPLGGVLRFCASIVPQSKGVRVPINALVELTEKTSCRANKECRKQ